MSSIVKKRWPPKTYFQRKLWELIDKKADGKYIVFAKKANIPQSTFKQYITGVAKPKLGHHRKICKTGKVPLSYFDEYQAEEIDRHDVHAPNDILNFSHRLNHTKIFDIRGAQYTLKEFVGYATEILASDHNNADSLARNILSFLGPVRESQGKPLPKKKTQKKSIAK